MQIRLATRGSRLALAQSGMIADALRGLGAGVELVRVKTLGDLTSAPLSSLGGVGVFVAAVREAVLRGACDVAVHSLKDMPMEMAPGFTIGAVPIREDPRDTLVCNKYATIEALPDGAVVGTSSLRREAQLREKNPSLNVRLLRGNVNTRVRKLDEGQYDAMILAEVADVGMLFVRCGAGGVSHNPAETITAEDAGAAVRALLAFLRDLRFPA